MTALEIVFWACATLVVYAYAGYPLLLTAWARWCKRPEPQRQRFAGSVSVVLTAHDEEANLARRLAGLSDLLEAAAVEREIIVVSDGSTDATAAIAREFPRGPVRVVELQAKQGKAAALSAGCAVARHDILVFADARQTWSATALDRLLENFADPQVGAVSGDLILESAPGVMAGVGLYWRFEKWLRRQESRVHSTVGVTGAISAVRRTLFRPVPAGTLLDDVYWPLRVVLQGYRVVHDDRAHAYDRLPEKARDEFRRKVRTLSGNFQLLTRFPGALLPWRNPVWLQWLSHKLLRLLVPWALLAMLAISAILPGPLFLIAFRLQIIGYVIGLSGLFPSVPRHLRPAGAAASFLVLNAAAWLAFWTWTTGRAETSWKKISYRPTQT
jgi:cellulose synthase/poly-beta-1,6-N-acetylglucosamine synthase-like glycosyltransferase